MVYPSKTDFLELFGIEPVEEDPSSGYFRYVKSSSDGNQELEFSFNIVARSFQVVLRCGGKKLACVSSENMRLFKLHHDKYRSGFHVEFDIHGRMSEADVTLEPDLICNWWMLES